MTGRKISRWESELQSYLSVADGVGCLFYDHCHCSHRSNWCNSDNRSNLDQLLDYRRSNLSGCDFIEYGTCDGILQTVEMLALEYLIRGGIHHPPVPTEVALLTDEEHPVEVRPVALKAHHGAIWCLKDGWIIHLKKDDPFTTQRFTLFHEVFHILAHHRNTPVSRKRGHRETPFTELLANYFAACVLMPREWIRKNWKEVHDIKQMAKVFAVPKTAMSFRLKYLGLLQ